MFWCILLLATLISGTVGNASLNVTGIRLAGGSGPYEGRVEVRVNGLWGTICNNNFDLNDAKVLCRMMNLSDTAYAGNARYGQGKGPIFATNLRCNGYETHIPQCSYDLNTICTHAKDVSIICSKCGYIHIVNGEIASITSDGTTLSATCKSGFYLNDTTSHCNSSGRWTPPSLICKPKQPITNMRLTNGLGLFDGRVELMMNGTWGDVCTDSFGRNEADAICRMMFNFPYSSYYTSISSSYYGYNTHVHIDELECLGNETDIQQCNFDFRTSCSTTRRAIVICDAYPLNITGIRLINGTGSNNGRVELKYNNTWGTVCNRYLNQHAANTLCRMLNSSLTWSYTNAKFGSGTGPMLIGRLLSCSSSSDHINSCSTYQPPNRYSYSCSKNYITALICTDCGQPSIPNGQVLSSNGIIMTVTCNTGYAPNTYTIECLSNGTWLQNETCEVVGYPLNITDMRLANGVGLYDGRLEVQVNGTWGTVCYNSFTSNNARAICTILFGRTNYRFYGRSYYYGSGNGPIYLENLHCKGTESHIYECKYNILNTCSHSKDTVVACNAAPLTITDIRLTNGTGPHNGRVELLVDGVWGTVCNYRVNLNVANTLCNMMNLSLWSYYTTPVYGMGLGPIHVDSLSCGGSYSHINQCSYRSPFRGYHGYCTHKKDLSLACTDNRLNITDIRLAPGPYHGRVEINVNNSWGTMCDNGFDSNGGRVICRMMNGLNVSSVYSNAYYGEGTGHVHIERLSCSGNEADINKCSYTYDNSCDHSKDSSVLCYGPGLNITRARLANGRGSSDGRVEIKVNGTWGTICDFNFNINDAEAFCQMLDLRATKFFTGARYGEGTGPVHVDELNCSLGTTDLNKCPYLFTNTCGHERDVSVVCSECGQLETFYWDYFNYNGTTLNVDCAYYRTYVGTFSMTCNTDTQKWISVGECNEYRFPLDIRGIRLVDGNASSDGRVEIKSMDTWGTICDDGFGKNEANTICRMLGFWPAVTFYTGAKYGAGAGPIFVDNLRCGTEDSHINNCSYVTYDNCVHSEDISVVCLDCGDPTPLNAIINTTKTNYGTVVEVSCETGYRLVGNNTISCEISGNWSNRPHCQYIGFTIRLWPLNERRNEGFVEVYNEGEWGFLGSTEYRFSDLSASYLCRKLKISEFGYGGIWTPVGSYKGFSWLSYIDCNTNGTCVNPPYAKGLTFEADASTYYLKYGNSLHCVDATLVNGETHNVGTLQTSIYGQKYTVCFDGFNMNAAEVVCNNLGFRGAVTIAAVDIDATQIYYKAFICDGSEYSLLQCDQSTNDLLNCQKIVQITCKAVRLMSTNENHDEGAVEIFYNGTWGFVGDPGFVYSDQTAHYLCDKFGFGQSGFGAMAHTLEDYDRNAWYNRLECLGNETHIMQCDHDNPYVVPPLNNTYYRGSWLYCFDFNITNIRLLHGYSYNDGKVQLEINGRWGSICTVAMSSTQSIFAGNILCQTMGFRSVASFYEDTGNSTDLIWMSYVQCSGSETAISECSHIKGSFSSCYHTPRYLGLICNDYNDCESNPCLNDGSCIDAFKNYTCECQRPWSGVNCEIDMEDNCVVGMCFNGATCVDRFESFECHCVEGFDGQLCQNNIDECELITCQNGGSCEDRINGYTCYCANGFEGKQCQIVATVQISLIAILVSAASVLLIVIVIIVCCYVRYRRRKGKKKKSGSDESEPTKQSDGTVGLQQINDDKSDGYANLYSTISDEEVYNAIKDISTI